MNRFIIRPLTLTTAAALTLATPLCVAASPLAWAADSAEDNSTCDADSQHAFTRGHQDLALIGNSGDLDFVARDDESGRDYSSGDFYVEVGSNAAFEDSAGADIPSRGWQIPQTQDPDIPWLGFNTSYIDEDTARDATLSMTLHSGPEGGRVVGFQNALGGAPTVLFDSENPDASWDYPDHFHSHTGIVFTEPGAYAVTFTFTLNDGSEYSIDVPFLVDGADSSELCQLDWGSTAGSTEGSGSGNAKSRPQQLAKDINDTSKAIAQLDKTMDKTFKEADAFLTGGSPSESKAPRESRRSRESRDSERSKAKEPTQQENKATQEEKSDNKGNSSRRQDSNAAPRPASQRQEAQRNAPAHKERAQRDSAQRDRSERNPKDDDKKTARDSQPAQNRAAGEDSDTMPQAENIQAMSYGAPMVGFWAGFLAGMGALSLLLGIGLFIAVQFFRPRRRD